MKKIFIFAAAVATLAACQKNSPVELVNDAADNNAIGFSAYTATAVTKGESVAATDIYGSGKDGIGVFAFYQPATNGVVNNFNSTKYATPDFMYNQQVKSEDGSTWTYSPLKYWPNNTNDQLSFFAYAPYKAGTTWEDLGFSTDINATKLTATFPIYNEKTAMVDYLFAEPAINQKKPAVGSDPIKFKFEHITSRIALNVGVNVNALPAEGPQAFPAVADGTGTLITVNSVKITNIAEAIEYTLAAEASAGVFVNSTEVQDLVLTADDFQNNTSASWDAADWKVLLAAENTKPGYLFIAPQAANASKLVITYTVATTDKSNPANNSTITNVIEKPITTAFEKGKAYALNLLIGMKTVDLSAEVVEWKAGSPETERIDVPANN